MVTRLSSLRSGSTVLQYLGGKSRVAKRIAAFLSGMRTPRQPYVEPMVGAANVIAEMPSDAGPRFAGDVDHELIALWQAAQRGWVPPTLVSEDDYQNVRNDNQAHPALRAFVKFGCSFGGRAWAGYARAIKSQRNYAEVGSRSVVRKARKLADVTFVARSYDAWAPVGALCYIDPPYESTTPYKGMPPFDHAKFWQAMRRWSLEGNTVVVSSYEAPADFSTVLELPHTRGLDDKRVVERLFMYAPSAANDNRS
jgi:DNA adenine methylase